MLYVVRKDNSASIVPGYRRKKVVIIEETVNSNELKEKDSRQGCRRNRPGDSTKIQLSKSPNYDFSSHANTTFVAFQVSTTT